MKINKEEQKISIRDKYLVSLGTFAIGLINFVISLTSNEFSSDDRIAWILMSLVMTLGGAGFTYYLIVYGKKKKLNRLNSIFFELIKEKKGKITLIDFAIKTQVEASVAREFLEKKAIEFSAQPEISEDGEVIYNFIKTPNY